MHQPFRACPEFPLVSAAGQSEALRARAIATGYRPPCGERPVLPLSVQVAARRPSSPFQHGCHEVLTDQVQLLILVGGPIGMGFGQAGLTACRGAL
jgi:hypothetical protein